MTIAEIHADLGQLAAARLKDEFADSPLLFVQTDVRDEESVGRIVAATEARFGRSGYSSTTRPWRQSVADTPIADWDRSYDVNLRGPVLLTQACLPSMLAMRHGVLLSVSSTGGPYLCAYETHTW